MTSQQPEAPLPSPHRLVQLLLESGWERVGGRGDRYVRFRPPGDELGPRRRSLLVPLEGDASDFSDLMQEAVDALQHLPSNSAAFTLISRLTTTPTDQFAFSKETTAPKGWIGWEAGESLIRAARALLVAGAKTSRERRTYFGNRYGQFANRFLDEVMMGQTEVGSYVVRAYVPVERAVPLRGGREAVDEVSIFGNVPESINTRDVSRAVVRALEATTEALAHYMSSSRISAFTSPELDLSYEAVQAVRSIAVNADHAGVTVTWDGEDILGLPQHGYEQEFTFTAAHVPILERAANELVRPEPQRTVSANGTVHLLSRSDAGGPGIVGLTTLSGQPAKKLRVRLESEDYHRALNAHDEGRIIFVTGDLEREGNLSWLYNARITRVGAPERDIQAPIPGFDDEPPF